MVKLPYADDGNGPDYWQRCKTHALDFLQASGRSTWGERFTQAIDSYHRHLLRHDDLVTTRAVKKAEDILADGVRRAHGGHPFLRWSSGAVLAAAELSKRRTAAS